MSLLLNTYAWYFIPLIIFEVLLISEKRRYVSDNNLPNTPLNYDIGYDYRATVSFAILVFLPLILIAGLREQYSVGDTWLYVNMYNNYPDKITELPEFITGEEKDVGFIIFSTIIKRFFGSNFNAWLTIIAVISAGCLALTYRKYTSEIVLCAFLFFASTDFMSWMMNGMRQFFVVAILFAAFSLLQNEKKTRKVLFIAIVLLLSTFHSSCLLVIPLYLVALGKPFNKKTMLILVGILLCVVFLDAFTGFLDQALEETDYSGVVNQMEEDDGTNVLRVLIYSIPAIFATIFRKKVPENAPDIINVSINMSLISMGFYVLSIFTSGIFIGRIPIYFSLFNYILLPWEIRTFFDKGIQKIIYGCLIVGYLLYFVLQMQQWGFI